MSTTILQAKQEQDARIQWWRERSAVDAQSKAAFVTALHRSARVSV